jgi:hypothetical protein
VAERHLMPNNRHSSLRSRVPGHSGYDLGGRYGAVDLGKSAPRSRPVHPPGTHGENLAEGLP